ncbi:MAG: NADPH:quinone reductase [Rhodospirillaceae bacterium TMED8]|nr:NADPH:quinone reductase [Magnetovibrio sp.]OUT50892.1 MAG: NADPH:quinone reductase [Rhodospirillaceae bacterium TMED8]|tara:strand:- start:1560 stop:2429 length:870 start_codon:yes stop_codon:yes gene_type:complete
MSKTVITCAVTGSAPTPAKNSGVPVTPQQIAESSIEAWRAGASIVHIHVRDPETGAPSMKFDYYKEVTERIRDSESDVLINLTTGPGARLIPGIDDPLSFQEGTTVKPVAERVAHIEKLKPDICSLDIATMNFNQHVFLNTPDHLRLMANRIKAVGVKPELEVFDTGQIVLAQKLIDEGYIKSPAYFQLCLGISYGARATPEAMMHMRDMLPEDCLWSAFGISRQQFPMAAQAVLLGGNLRVGMEDNIYLGAGELAPSNAALVERAARIVLDVGGEVASPIEAREILGV